MTVPVLEQQPFTYATLDDLAAQATAAALGVWVAADTIPLDEVADLLADLLVNFMVQAEEIGRMYGRVAPSVDGTAILPTSTLPRRPPPREFDQLSKIAPAPSPTLAGREQEIRPRVERAARTLVEPLQAVERYEVPQVVVEQAPRVEKVVRDEVVSQAQRGFQDGVRIEQLTEAQQQTIEQFMNRPEGLQRNRGARQTPRTTSTSTRGYRRGINPDCCELCFWLWKEGYVYPIDQPMHRHTGCRCVPVPTTDPVGRWKMSEEETELLGMLYEKYQEPRNAARRAGQRDWRSADE